MTNSFIDYLAAFEFLDAPPNEAWEYFCESNYAKQIQIIEQYAADAFDAGRIGIAAKERFVYENFNGWKNEVQ